MCIRDKTEPIMIAIHYTLYVQKDRKWRYDGQLDMSNGVSQALPLNSPNCPSRANKL